MDASHEAHAALRSTGYGQSAAVLKGVHLHGTADGPLLDLSVEQTYANESTEEIEAVYTFPLPPRAVLAGFEFELNGKVYVGSVRPKSEAGAGYERALDEGDTPVLVERAADGMFTANLGNLMLGDRAVIRLRYVQIVESAGQDWRIGIPTVLAPLYGDPTSDGGLAPHQIPTSSLLAEYPLSFDLLLRGDVEPEHVRCPSHAVTTTAGPDGVRLQSAPGARLDRDIVVLARRDGPAWSVSAPDPDGRVGFGVVLLPEEVDPSPAPKSIRIVLDCSGSMAGASMDWAVVACQRLVGSLAPADEFSITRFGSTCEHMRPRLVQASKAQRDRAIRWLRDVQADLGGTEMEAGLQAAGELPGREALSDLVLITDGEIWAADKLIRWARGSGRRVFVVGVGASPNAVFLRELAAATGATCEVVTPGEDVVRAVERIATRIRAHSLGRLPVQWPAEPLWSLQWPARPIPGEAIIVLAGFSGAVDGALEVQCQGHETATQIRAVDDPDMLLARVAAYERLRSGHFDDPAPVAVKYQLVSEWTSLLAVAVREGAERAAGLPLLAPVPHMVPAGWGGLGRAQIHSPAFYRSSLVSRSLDAPAAFLVQRSVSGGWYIDPEFAKRLAPRLRPVALRLLRIAEAVRAIQQLLLAVLSRVRRLLLLRRVSGGSESASLDDLECAALPAPILEKLRAAVENEVSETTLAATCLDALGLLLDEEREHRFRDWESRWAKGDRATRRERRIVKAAIDSFLLEKAPPDETVDLLCTPYP